MVKTPNVLLEELDTGLSPIALFELFRYERFCFFLDSAMDPQKLGRYSLMGGTPFLLLKSRGDSVNLTMNGKETTEKGNVIDILARYLESYRLDTKALPVPCASGAIGYFSYDICHLIERLPATAVDDLNLPESYFGFYDMVVVYDNLLKKPFIVSTGFPDTDEKQRLVRAKKRIDELKNKLSQLTVNGEDSKPRSDSSSSEISLTCNFTHEAYIKAVEKARQYIIDGDIFEVNISQRFETELSIPPYELYLRLRKINPAPFSAYLDFDEITVVSASPERFLRCQGDLVETRPIKGTTRRGKTPEEDRKKAEELLGSVKDHAENMMIVDLERNDLGRVCRYGTVKVTELAILETYPTVFHLTSTVVGQLREDVGRVELLKATLPGGSITGAPKVRAMEIIDELEPTRRSIYTGNIGYLSFDGNMDLSIVIRTFLIKGNRAYFQLGGAVVYDSDPEAEYQETLDKGRALVSALNKM